MVLKEERNVLFLIVSHHSWVPVSLDFCVVSAFESTENKFCCTWRVVLELPKFIFLAKV